MGYYLFFLDRFERQGEAALKDAPVATDVDSPRKQAVRTFPVVVCPMPGLEISNPYIETISFS